MSEAIFITSIGRPQLYDTLASLDKSLSTRTSVYLSIQDDFYLDASIYKFIDLKIFYHKKRGASLGKNLTLKNSTEKKLLFIDDDIIVDKNWIQEMLSSLDEHDLVFGKTIPYLPEKYSGMICTCCFEKKNFEQRITTGVVKHWLEVGFSNNMAINRTIFNKVGYFKEWLGPGSIGRNGLDAEFILRCLLSGKSIYYNQKSICYHNSWFKISDFIYKNIDYELGGLLAYGYHYFKTKNTQVRSIFLSNISDLLDIGSIPYKFTIIVKDANLFSLISFTREYVTRFYLFIFGICLVYYKYLTDK